MREFRVGRKQDLSGYRMRTAVTFLPIVDVEASGLHFHSYPIEIAVLGPNEVAAWLIAPEPDWTHWNAVAEDMHGISRRMLHDQGTRALIVARELNALVERLGGVLYSDAADWDFDWIRTLYCTVRMALEFDVVPIQRLLSPKQRQRFAEIRQQLEASGRYRVHRAGPDVRLIHEAYCQAIARK